MPEQRFMRCVLCFVVFCSLTGLSGCGGGGRETVEVTGTVTLDGQPVAEAAVMFSGPEGGSPATTQTDAAGHFTVRAVPGSNGVAVSKLQTSGSAAAGEDGLMPATGAPVVPQSLVPTKYSDFRTSGLLVEVASGMAEVKLELSSN